MAWMVLITSAGEWETVELAEVPGQKLPEIFSGREVLPNMTVWAFEPNGYVGMQSPPAGIRLWAFYAAKPLLQRAVFERTWSLDDMGQADEGAEQERSEDELKAHAIN